MTGIDIAQLIRAGRRLIVTFNADAYGPMGYLEASMRGRLVGCRETEHGDLAMMVDLREFEAHNQTLETPNYRDGSGEHRLTAREAGQYRPQIEIIVEPGDTTQFDVAGESMEVFTEYLGSGSMEPYALWLEGRLLALRTTA